MRKMVIFCFLVFFVLAGTALPFNDGHSLVTGIVNDIAHDFITIDDMQYVLSPGCKFEIEYKVDNAFYLRPATLSDISRGDSVIAVKLANTVTEIKIERWKR